MGLIDKKIIGVKITVSSKDIILEEIRKYLRNLKSQNSKLKTNPIRPLVIFTPNPEIVEYAQKKSEFRKIVNCAQINIPDGQGICWAIKKLHRTKVFRISGTDFMLDLCKAAEKEGLRIGLIGGREAVALATLECLKKKLPKLKGWAVDGPEIKVQSSKFKVQSDNSTIITLGVTEGVKDTSGVGKAVKTPGRWPPQSNVAGTFDVPKDSFQVERLDISKIINKIIQKQTDILFVALGHPKQEYFIDSLRKYLCGSEIIKNKGPSINPNLNTCTNASDRMYLCKKGIVMMAVGGAFDYISGKVPRAPDWMKDRGLEWLYRLIREPGRWRRQLVGIGFFWRVLKER